MIKYNTVITQLKIVIFFALINSSIFTAFHLNEGLRLMIATLMNISGVILISFFFKRIKRKLDVSMYFKVVITLLVIWSFYTVFRSFVFDSKSLITLFGHNLMGWAWVTPLAIAFGFNISNWLNLFDFFSRLLLITSILAIGSFFYEVNTIFGLLEWMAFFPIILLTYFHQSKYIKKILLFTIVAFLLLSFFASQRANLLFLILLNIFLVVEYFRASYSNLYKKVSIIITIIIIGLVFMLQDYSIENLELEKKEVATDTRSFLFEELYADMSDHELLIGRGTLGTYFSPYFEYTTEHGLGGDSPIRSSIEVGYLQIIFKGGYIMLALYLLILLPAAYLGIVKSNNIIGRMSGYFILSYLVLWFISYYPIYSAEYLLLWMAAGTAISKSTRSLSNQDLINMKNRNYEVK